MHPVETYLKTLGEIHSTGGGSKEESYYGALENLLNEVGSKLKPKVRAVSQLKNTGAGEPDFGLYTANQFQRAKDAQPMEGILPERGVVEVKGWDDDSFATSKSPQVTKYWQKYGLVLVTNYRDFVLVGKGPDGKPARLELYQIATNASTFAKLFAHPHKAARENGNGLLNSLPSI